MSTLADQISGLIPAFKPAEGQPPQTLGAFAVWTLRGAWGPLWLAGGISALAGASEVFTALLLGWVVDSAITATPETYLDANFGLIALFLSFFLLFRPVTFGISSALNSILVSPQVQTMANARLHRWTMEQSVGYFDDDFAGRIAQKQMQTASAVTNVASEVINVVFFALASLIGSVVLLTAVDGRVAVVLALWIIVYLSAIRWFMPRIRVRSRARAAARAVVTGQIVDTVTNIKTVKLFANDDHEDATALNAMEETRQKMLRFGTLSALFRLCLMILAGILPVTLIGGMLLLWGQGLATPGDIVAAGAVSLRLSQMTGWVSFTLMAIYANVGEIEDGMRTLAVDRRVQDAEDATALDVTGGSVTFDNVTFRYPSSKQGITDLSIALAPGEKLGIVGASGAGKSTLVALLLRLYDAQKGAIWIDEQTIHRVTQDSLRRAIGMVTQETAMFNRSAMENIRYGRPEATDAEVIEAARRAEAHDFITELRDHKEREGYDAHLGERGVKLSGGQRQRIALARTILKDAPILVLDEATSALDSEVEAAIQGTLEEVMDGKTVLAIAHRLSTIARMDRIIVMEAGQIVEEGTHGRLLDQGGLYARYWARQSGGFIGVQEAAE
ncbi:MAG: ABC transporter ATP-binding protein [Pseudomonadota bacterium]